MNFLRQKQLKKNFEFVDNLAIKNKNIVMSKPFNNLVISKSGNTIETIVNFKYFNQKKRIKI